MQTICLLLSQRARALFFTFTFTLLALTPVRGQEAKPPDLAGQAPTAEMLPGKGPAQKGERFDRVWTQRRAEFRANKEASRGALVFLGDSITQGWGDPQKYFPKYHC